MRRVSSVNVTVPRPSSQRIVAAQRPGELGGLRNRSWEKRGFGQRQLWPRWPILSPWKSKKENRNRASGMVRSRFSAEVFCSNWSGFPPTVIGWKRAKRKKETGPLCFARFIGGRFKMGQAGPDWLLAGVAWSFGAHECARRWKFVSCCVMLTLLGVPKFFCRNALYPRALLAPGKYVRNSP